MPKDFTPMGNAVEEMPGQITPKQQFLEFTAASMPLHHLQHSFTPHEYQNHHLKYAIAPPIFT